MQLRSSERPWYLSLGLVVLSSLLFAASFPHPLAPQGWGFLAFFAYTPLFFIIRTSSLPQSLAWGALHGLFSYGLLTFWLGNYNLLALLVVLLFFAFWHALLALMLHFIFKRAGSWSLWPAAFVFVFWEFAFSQGFTGFSYGILGHTQAFSSIMIQGASVGGVWIVSFLVALPSILLAQLNWSKPWPLHFTQKWNFALYGLLFLLNLGFGISQLEDFGNFDQWKPALIQHNLDPWKGGYANYRVGLDRLINLSEKALVHNPDAVIWSETAFVPAITYHERYRDVPQALTQIRLLKSFLSLHAVPFILGNSHSEKIQQNGRQVRGDWNSALYFQKGELQGLYRKVHLVPFTEHFPFKDAFPGIYQFLLDQDTHYWEAGTDFSPINLNGLMIGTPICFEDSFGYISRNFVLQGAQVLVNLTNDSWSGSRVAMDQHLASAIFRSVENHRSLVRASNGGLTASIDPVGRLLSTLEPFTEDVLFAQVPLVQDTKTVYTQWGDWFPWACLMLLTLSWVILGFIYLKTLKPKLTD